MKSWQKFGTCLAAVTLLTGGSAAWAGGGSADPVPAPGNTAPVDGAVAAAAVHDAAVESRYTAIKPCRIVDTRKAGGKLSAGSSRSFIAAGTTGFTGQGGNSTGCQIPDAATSIDVTVTANAAGGKGYLKAYPDNISAPTTTIMNYTNLYHVSVGGAIALDTAGSYDFKVSNYTYSTHVIVDVLGYAVKPMWAYVNSEGTLLSGSRVVATSSLGGPGWYQVTFDRDVSKCAYNASAYFADNTIEVEPRLDTPNAVWVAIRNLSAAGANVPFYLTVTC